MPDYVMMHLQASQLWLVALTRGISAHFPEARRSQQGGESGLVV
jgi:hypothetical protein